MQNKQPQYYRIEPAIVAPVITCCGIIALAYIDSYWWLLAIPFAVLASFCGQPNLNLADGCLAYLSIMFGLMLTHFHRESGIAILIGTLVSFYLAAIEKRIRAKPVYIDDNIQSQGKNNSIKKNG